MVYLLYTLFFLSCIVLVGSVLLQPGKTDAGALFTSSISSSAFAPRGTTTVLSKITISAAAVFMLSGLFLSMPAFTGGVSVLNANPDTPAEAPANTDANANTAAPAVAANSNAAPADSNTASAPGAPDTNAAIPTNVAPANVPAANTPAANKTAANAPAKTQPAKNAPAKK